MEWHALSCGNVLYFVLDDIDSTAGGGVQATVCSARVILNTASLADRATALTWLAREGKAKLHDHYCTIRCHLSDS